MWLFRSLSCTVCKGEIMLDPNAVNKIEKAISLINKDNWAPAKILKQLLRETEDDINNIASMQSKTDNANIMDRIPIVLAKLKKETGYGEPEKSNIPTKSVQRHKNRTFDHRREWDPDK